MTARLRPPPAVLLLIAVAASPWVAGLDNELQDVDSAQYADVAKFVATSGQWLELRDSTGPFVNKPPLAIWAQALGIKVLGPTSVAARLPSLLFALLAVGATFGLGRALFDPTRGAVAAGLLAASVAMQQMVLDPKVDLALTAMATLSLWAFVEGRQRPALVWLGWGFAGLAVLSKGPLGLALPAAAIAPEALRHAWGAAEKGSFTRRLFSLKPLRGLLIVAAISAPYYVSVYLRDGAEGAGFVLWQQNIGRLFGQSGYSNQTTPLFFLHTALWVFLPFTPLLLIALARRAWQTPAQRLVWWGFVLPFAVFSISTYKLPQYIYCLAPVAALIAADTICGIGPQAASRIRIGMAALGLLAAAATVWLLVDCFPPPSLLGIGLAVLMPVVAWVAPGEPVWKVTGATVASLAALHLTISVWVFPAATVFQGGKALADRARAEDPGAYMLPYIGVPSTFSASYYSRTWANPIGLDELRALVETHKLNTAVVKADDWPDFAAAGLKAESIAKFPAYPTSRPKLAFMRASTRATQLEWRELVRVTAR